MAFYGRPKSRRKVSTGVVTGSLGMVGDARLQLAAVAFSQGPSLLPFGINNLTFPGTGPKEDTSGLAWRSSLTIIAPSEIDAWIDAADQFDVHLCVEFCGGRSGYAPGAVFSRSLYESKVRRFTPPTISNTLFNKIGDRLTSGRLSAFTADEANRTETFGTTFNPDDVNWCGNLHKTIWPGCRTVARMASGTLAVGWNGQSIPPNWNGLDYGWYQRSSVQNDETLQQSITREKNAMAAGGVNLGAVLGLNIWDGGVTRGTVDTVQACWDTGFVGGASPPLGVMAGAGPPAPYTDGQVFPCASIPSNLVKSTCSPAWIRRFADVVSQDPDAPFCSSFNVPNAGAGNAYAIPLFIRQDFVDAFDYAIAKCNARTQFNATRWNNPKVGVLV